MKKSLLLFFSIIISIIFPFLVMCIMYSLLNFTNYIYIANVSGFLRGNIDFIVCILILSIFTIILTKYNLSNNIFKIKDYIVVALIGQIMSCLLLLVTPIIILLLFNFALSQMYLYGLFNNFLVALIINLLITLLVTVLIFIIAAILPILYAGRAIQKYNEATDNKLIEECIYIRPFKMLINLIKMCFIIKKYPNVA